MSDIKVGDGVTMSIGSDRYPFTVIEVVSETCIVIQECTAKHAAGYDYYNNQVYEYEDDPDGQEIVLTKRKCGGWFKNGLSRSSSYRFTIGVRRKYQDPHR